jgi:SulP family sulfate permease
MLTAAGLLLAGLLRTGRLIRFVPKTVILGFMSGIAMVIWVDQIKVLFGLDGKEAPTGPMHLNLAYSAITFLLILTLPKLLAKLNLPKRVAMFIPATLTSIIIMTVITTVFSIDIQHISLGAPVSSLGEFKQMMLSYLPTSRIMTQEHLLMAAPYALQLIMLGYLDSLLTALIMDHLTSKKSRLDKELVGQGLANGLSALLGGIPGAQATIRSVLLFKEGAHTRIGAMSAGVFTLLGLVAFRNSIGLITSAVFIGVLFKAALDVFEKEFLTLYVKRRWYTSRKRNIQIAFIMYTMLLTAFYDLNVAVISATILHYVCKRFWRIADVEDKLEKAVEEELAKHVRA